ncbi:MAG: C4-dicarboxylate ABC transporter permease [Gammaproteobacteria bacterium]|nr:C4-dicarboxylate ABC transporter permease [Gammaproteobacteria bacterium]|tara:strand:+ start:4286 stop:4774 length:489 start_codon:yes stop_codon:yes gene_type:complete
MQGEMFKRLLHGLHRFEDGALIAALASMLILAIVQIALRNIFDSGLLWVESFLRILVLWVAILGAMVATREKNHINIDALSRYAPRGLRLALQLCTTLFAAATCTIVAWYSVEFIQFEYEDQTIAFASVPTWVCQSILPIGFTVMAVRFVHGAISDILVRQH